MCRLPRGAADEKKPATWAGSGGLGPGETADQALSRTQSAAQASERAWAAAPLVISHTSEPVAKVRGTRARITEIMEASLVRG